MKRDANSGPYSN